MLPAGLFAGDSTTAKKLRQGLFPATQHSFCCCSASRVQHTALATTANRCVLWALNQLEPLRRQQLVLQPLVSVQHSHHSPW